ncbi:MAG: HNH endonuclease signature motif containing protein [Ornithinimicrobium sp.]
MAIAANEPVWTSPLEKAPCDPLASMGIALHALDVPSAVAEGMMALLACHQGHRLQGSVAASMSQDASNGDESTVKPRARVAGEEVLDSETLLDAAHGARVVQNFADAMLVTAARTLADRAGREFLGRKGVASPEELAPTARERWRAKTKSVVAQELATLTGYGVNACHARVGFALAPRPTVAPAERAMFEGVTDWRAVSQYWQRCRTMGVEDATKVGDAVFAPLLVSATPEDVDASEPGERGVDVRLETWQEFHRRLDREATRVEGEDAAAERERRRRARQTRDTRAEIFDDGLGALFTTAGAASVVASIERIETIARRARKAGDKRSLAHIRSDTTMALLVHGVLPFGDPPDGHGETTTQEAGAATGVPGAKSQGSTGGAHESSTGADQSSTGADQSSTRADQSSTRADQGGTGANQSSTGSALLQPSENVCRIIAGLPNASVEVVVPISAFFSDEAPTAASASPGDEDLTESDPEVAAGSASGAERARTRGQVDLGAVAMPHDPSAGLGSREPHSGTCTADGEPSKGTETAERSPESRVKPRGEGRVAEIPGHGWVSAAYARELAISQGAVLHRLLTDPADGRLLERSTKAYRPDAALRAHVQALDRRCRAPGCTIPAHRCELDHEIPFGTEGGVTNAANLNPKHARHHQLETEQFWASTMDETRAVTWTTLFGRMYTTYAHDYREYWGKSDHDPTVGAAGADGGEPPTLDSVQPVVADDPDLRDQLVYAALSSREGRDTWLEAMDDDPEHTEGQWDGVPLSLFHREGGRRRPGSPPAQASVGQLLGVEPTPTVPESQPPRVIDPGPPPF